MTNEEIFRELIVHCLTTKEPINDVKVNDWLFYRGFNNDKLPNITKVDIGIGYFYTETVTVQKGFLFSKKIINQLKTAYVQADVKLDNSPFIHLYFRENPELVEMYEKEVETHNERIKNKVDATALAVKEMYKQAVRNAME